MSKLRGRVSYANVMATIAVFIALGGASYAATQLPKNSVGPKQLKKNAVSTAKVRNEAITAAKVKKGALTGAQIDASTLGVVPQASHASQAETAGYAATAGTAGAVGGLSVLKFARKGPVAYETPVTLLSLGGLQLKYACIELGGSDAFGFWAETTVDNARLFLSRTFGGGSAYEAKQPFESGQEFAFQGFVGTAVYEAPGGRVVTFTYAATLSCDGGVAGTAYGG